MSGHDHGKELPSLVKSLFYGEVLEDLAFPYPSFSESQVEMAKAMVDAVDKFAHDNIDSAKFDKEAKIPAEVLQGLAALGLCGLGVSEDFGGLGLDTTLYARVFSQVAGIDGAIATTLGAHQSIGYKALINEGSEEQKKVLAPKTS